jgi:hypothetical protein
VYHAYIEGAFCQHRSFRYDLEVAPMVPGL